MVVSISTLAAIAGRLPPRAMGLIVEWASMHHDELMREWERLAFSVSGQNRSARLTSI